MLVPAYEQEARLLGASPFPPALRTVADIQGDTDCWLGAFEGAALAGALAFAPDAEPGQFIVNTLVVHPAQQRRGVARALLHEALRLGGGHAFAVATGEANTPALALYRSLGFEPYRRGSIGPQALPLVKLRRPPGPADPID